jgi:hypothetical protein
VSLVRFVLSVIDDVRAMRYLMTFVLNSLRDAMGNVVATTRANTLDSISDFW